MKLTPAAATSTSSSPGPGAGSSRSPRVRTSGPPWADTTTARIRSSCHGRQRKVRFHPDAHVAVGEPQLLVDRTHAVVALLGPGVDLGDAVPRRPPQGGALEGGGDAPAAPVPADRGEALLGTVGPVGVEDQRGESDDLLARERDEGRLRGADPVALPLLRRDLLG